MLWTLAICFRATDAFKLFDNTRQLFVILTVSFHDSRAFLAILVVIMVEFGLAQQFIVLGDQDANLLEHTGLVYSQALGGFESPGTGSDA
jgi:hypothetical protein